MTTQWADAEGTRLAYDVTGDLFVERGFRLAQGITGETRSGAQAASGVRAPVVAPVFTIAVPRYDDLHVIKLYRSANGRSDAQPELLGEVRP